MNFRSSYFFYFLVLAVLLLNGCNNLEAKSLSVKQELNQAVEIGNQVGNIPESFELIDTQGRKIILDEMIESDNVIIYFFATWCPYCHKDLAELSKIYGNYSDVRLIIIGMDMEEDLSTIKDYRSRYPMLKGAYFARAEPPVIIKYDVKKTTTKYAIKDKRIVYAGSGVFSQKYWQILLAELSNSN